MEREIDGPTTVGTPLVIYLIVYAYREYNQEDEGVYRESGIITIIVNLT